VSSSHQFRRNAPLITDSHDYNDEIGKGESFSQTSDWQTMLPEWEAYARRQFGERPKFSGLQQAS
jgi:hypothetical protein